MKIQDKEEPFKIYNGENKLRRKKNSKKESFIKNKNGLNLT